MHAHDKSSPGDFQVHAHLHYDGGPVNPVASSMVPLREQKSGRFQLSFFMEFSMSALTFKFLIFCDQSLRSAALNK